MPPSGVSSPTTILSAWTRCLFSLLCRPSALRFPIHRSLVVLLLRLRPTSLRDNRDRLMVAPATICGSTFTLAMASPVFTAPQRSTPRSVLTSIWAAIQNRHRVAGLHPPLHGFGEFSAWTRCLSSLLGRPSALRFPIHRSLVVLLLRLRPSSLRDNRDRLLVALATICCLRVSELVALQVCDLWFDFHTGYGIPGFHGTAAVHVGRSKNDVERKGHHPALGRAAGPTLDMCTSSSPGPP